MTAAPVPLLPATPILWRATRAYSLPASVVPVLLGTALAGRGYAFSPSGTFSPAPTFSWLPFVLTLAGAILAHFGANVLNDYFDYQNGVDTRPEHGSGVLTGGDMTARQALVFGAALLVGAGGCGLALLARAPAVVGPLALLGLGCAVLYPAVLKKYALGDLLIITAFGLGLTLGAYGVQTGALSARQWGLVSLYAVPVSLLVDAILHANNLRDAPDDRAARVRTLATLLPPLAAQRLQMALVFGPLAFAAAGVVAHFLPVWSLATLLSLPALLKAYQTGSVPLTAQSHLLFGLLYVISLLPPPRFA